MDFWILASIIHLRLNTSNMIFQRKKFFFWQITQYFKVIETTYQPLKRIPKFVLKPTNKLMRLAINLVSDTWFQV